jgi:hypothetical protein
LQAVTRVKLEQASKVKSWMPTRVRNGEGRKDREEPGAGTRNSATNEHLIRSTRVVSTACREGDLQRVGEARGWRGSRLRNVVRKGGGQSGRRRGPYDRRGRVTPAEERALTSGVLVKEGRSGD